MEIKDIITIIIAVYGAILSTIVFIKTHWIKIDIDLMKNMTDTLTWETHNYFKVTNKNKESILIESIWIKLLWEDKNKWYYLTKDINRSEVLWLRSSIFQSEWWFNLDKIKTVIVCTWHWKCYKKHFVNIFRRILNK